VINNYIESIIDNHQKEFGLYFSGTAREVIHESINKGIYAFNIIYSELQSNDMRVTEIKYLDHNLCVHEDQLNTWSQNKMWSYDGGQRFQWTEMETLIFDPSVIRNIKIESIL
jgi:hypothetical protein